MHKSPNVEEVYEFNDLEILMHNIGDVANFFGVSLKSFKEIDDFTKELEADTLLKLQENTQTVDDNPGMVSSSVHELRVGGAGNDYVNSIANINSEFSSKMETLAGYGTTLPDIVSPNDPIVRSVDINTKPKSYVGAAGASAKDQPTVSNFRPLVADPVFDGVNISIPRKVIEKVSTCFEDTLYGYFIGKRMAFPVVEYYVRNNWAKHGLTRIMMNNKGFFFFKFNSRADLETILEGGPWLIRKSPIILKNWSMDTRLLKEELARIPIWVKLHDVPIQVNSDFDILEVVTTSVPSLTRDDFTKETIRVDPHIVTNLNVVTPIVEKTNDGFQTVGKKKKRNDKSTSTNGGQFTSHSVKQNVRYEPKATTSAPKKGATNVDNSFKPSSMLKTTDTSSKNDNIITSNSYSTLIEEEEEVENVYDEFANLFQNTKTSGSSSFTAVVG
ncbi:zinc knuckle CX2CX4HX4C containing protein [Tanacetum coccineum]